MVCLFTVAAAGCGRDSGDGGEQGAADLWEAGAPAQPTVGLDSALVARALERATALPRLYSLIIARHGDIQAEHYFRGHGRNGRANLKSASKSVLSALIGIAVSEGKLRIDQPIGDFLASDIPADADPRVRTITIEQLLSMQAGIEPTSFGNYGRWVGSSNWVRDALARPVVAEPGTRMLYSTGNTHLLSAILTKATGMSTYAYAREKLARPLGVELVPWTRDPQGVYFGGNEMHMRARELLLFGELYRNGGRHDGKQVVPEEWVRASWTRRTSSPYNGHGYGLGWWQRRMRGHDVFFAWGYGGQYVFVVPDLELTVVMTSDAVSPREGDHNRALHEIMANDIIAAAIAGSE